MFFRLMDYFLSTFWNLIAILLLRLVTATGMKSANWSSSVLGLAEECLNFDAFLPEKLAEFRTD